MFMLVRRSPSLARLSIRGVGAPRVAPGQDRRAAGRALRLHVHVGEAQALGGQLVDARRRRAARRPAAVHTELAVAEVVDQDEEDVRLLGGLREDG